MQMKNYKNVEDICNETIAEVRSHNIDNFYKIIGMFCGTLLANNMQPELYAINTLRSKLIDVSEIIAPFDKDKKEEFLKQFKWFNNCIISRLTLLATSCPDDQILLKDILYYITTKGQKEIINASERFAQQHDNAENLIRINESSSTAIIISSPLLFNQRNLKKEEERLLKDKLIISAGIVTPITICAIAATAILTHGMGLIAIPFVVGCSWPGYNAYKYFNSKQQNSINNLLVSKSIDNHINDSNNMQLSVITPEQIKFTPTELTAKEAFEYIASVISGNHKELENLTIDEQNDLKVLVQSLVDSYYNHKELLSKNKALQSNNSSSFSWTKLFSKQPSKDECRVM